MSLSYAMIFPIDVPTGADSETVKRYKPSKTKFRIFCTDNQHKELPNIAPSLYLMRCQKKTYPLSLTAFSEYTSLSPFIFCSLNISLVSFWISIILSLNISQKVLSHYIEFPNFYTYLCVCVCVCVCVHACLLATQSCPTLCDPMGYSLPGSSVYGILQGNW